MNESYTFDNIPWFFKVRIPGEAFWIKMVYESNDYVFGVVDNYLIHTLDDYDWCKYDAKVKWHKVDKKLFEWIEEDNINLCFKHNDSNDSDADTCPSEDDDD